MAASDRLTAAGYTRESVDAYRRAAAMEQQRLAAALETTRARLELAVRRLQWLGEVPPPLNGADAFPLELVPVTDEGASATSASAERGDDSTSSVLLGVPGTVAYE